MAKIDIREAKMHLSKLLDRVLAGEEIIIAKAGKPVARLVPIRQRRKPRVAGTHAGKIEIPDDFDAPLPDEFLDSFEDLGT
jgi:prevent-host-death family protein